MQRSQRYLSLAAQPMLPSPGQHEVVDASKQSASCVAAGKLVREGGHAWHAEEPESGANVLAGHGVHFSVEVERLENPVGHGAHIVGDTGSCPASHDAGLVVSEVIVSTRYSQSSHVTPHFMVHTLLPLGGASSVESLVQVPPLESRNSSNVFPNPHSAPQGPSASQSSGISSPAFP